MSAVGSVVVTPDFEVVLFPTGDDAELVHDLDHFCVRENFGSLLHFRITQESVRKALRSGIGQAAILRLLENHCRTPLPQNVRFSIRDWAVRAGLMTLTENMLLSCQDADIMRHFLADPGTRNYVRRVVDEHTIQLESRATPRRVGALLRELGYLVELA